MSDLGIFIWGWLTGIWVGFEFCAYLGRRKRRQAREILPYATGMIADPQRVISVDGESCPTFQMVTTIVARDK